MNLINVGRFADAIRAFFDLNETAPTPEVGTQLLPTFDSNDPDATLRFLRNERLCGGFHSVAAGGAGTYGKIGLLNPAGSNVLAVIERIRIFNATGGLANFGVYIAPQAYGPGALGNKNRRDSRGLLPVCTINSVADAVVPAGGPGWVLSLPTNNNGNTEVVEPFVISPPAVPSSVGLWIVSDVANVPFSVAWWWRERTMFPQERGQP